MKIMDCHRADQIELCSYIYQDDLTHVNNRKDIDVQWVRNKSKNYNSDGILLLGF